MTITEMVTVAHQDAKAKGFHDEERNIGEQLMLVVSELGEAIEAHRKGRFGNLFQYQEMARQLIIDKDHIIIDTAFLREVYSQTIKGTFEEEIADAFIRLADLCGALGIEIEKHILAKMAYNRTREYRHGKNY